MQELRVLLAFNPRSGRGRGLRAAQSLHKALDGREFSWRGVGANQPGVQTRRCAVELLELGSADIHARIGEAHVLAVAGGDGSVHHLAPIAAAADVPLYHIPCGNENLLAREFGMEDLPQTLAAALAGWRIRPMDIAELTLPNPGGGGGAPGHFLLMCSFGPDASVIHDLQRRRTSAVGHAAYIMPVLRELTAPAYARLRVRVDGQEVVSGEPGILVVANSRQYALRMDPAVRASVSDGLLDVVFLPCCSRAGVIGWGLHSRLRRHEARAGLVYRQGREVEILAEQPTPFQLDGECPGYASGILEGRMRITVRPGALPILLPPR